MSRVLELTIGGISGTCLSSINSLALCNQSMYTHNPSPRLLLGTRKVITLAPHLTIDPPIRAQGHSHLLLKRGRHRDPVVLVHPCIVGTQIFASELNTR